MTCLLKQDEIKKIFNLCSTPTAKYEKIIQLGRALPLFNPSARTPGNLVHGCQSTMYLEALHRDQKLFFNADSEALISKGLAALLIHVYSGETPSTILLYPPLFLQEIGLHQALSPGRSNGLASLYLKMKQEALKEPLDKCFIED